MKLFSSNKSIKSDFLACTQRAKASYGLLTVLLSAGIIFAVLLPTLISNKGNLYLIGDHMTQQIPFIKESRRMFLSGEPFWSWNTFLGANFLGTYSFYVYGSPFFWPLLAFSEKNLAIGMSIMFMLKHIAAALFAYLYLKRHIKNQRFAVVGGILYAFSSFTMDSTYYYHFLDVVAFFPLLLYFIDEVLENRKSIGLVFIVMLCAVTNYYFFIATSIFILIYLIFRIKYSQVYQINDFIRCSVFYIAGTLASMIVLLPSALCMLETTKATDSYTTVLNGLYLFFIQIFEILKGIVFASEGVLGSASGILVANFCSNAGYIIFFGAVFIFSAFQIKSSNWDFKLFKFIFILSFIPFANGIFSLFTNINYTRWWYAFTIISILVSLKVIEFFQNNHQLSLKYNRRSAKAIILISSITVILPLVLKVLVVYVFKGFENIINSSLDKTIISAINDSELFTPFTLKAFCYIAVFLIMALINYMMLYIFIKKKWIYNAKKVLICVCVLCFATYSFYLTNETDAFNSKLSTYQGADCSNNEQVEYESRIQNKGFMSNYSMIANNPAITTFNSVKSHATTQFARIVGYEISEAPTTKAFFNTEAIQTVLGISHINQNGNKTKAPFYVPMGYSYDYYILDNGLEFSKDIKVNNKRIETMVSACYIDGQTAIKLSDIIKLLNKQTDWNKEVEELNKNTSLNVKMTGRGFKATVHGKKERLIYFSVPNDSGWKAYLNGKEIEIYTINGGMMGVIAPSGKASFEFKFITPGLRLGAFITCITLLSVFGYCLFLSLKKQNS